ncbi:hypothetical protein JTB14_015411 [Gonioctena quinquepunctata]|nr:hypothetical protein JTB14_015411 [Gonioctena quinquepunctata]
MKETSRHRCLQRNIKEKRPHFDMNVLRKMNNWRLRQPLNDDELLVAAEEAVIELANLPVDNEMITDEEQSDEEDEYSEMKKCNNAFG